jgi:ABC-type sugar transport system substrate-binding protein
VASQIPQFNSLIEQHVNLIMIEPNSTTALLPEVERAGKAGIPTVTTSGVIASPYALNWANNAWLNGAVPTAYIAYNYMHSKGNMLTLTGAPTQPTAIAGIAGAQAALRNCPSIKVVNPAPLVSQYSNSVAKSVVLQFLASYSGTINGVFDGGVVSTGIIGAFRQLGKPVPAVTNLGMIDGGLAYWYQHPSDFGSAATGSGGYEYDRVTVDMAVRLLEGKSPKLNTLIGGYCDLITPKNLDQLAQFNKSILGSQFNIDNINVGDVPPFTVRNSQQMNGYFNKSGIRAPVGLDSGNLPGLFSLLRQP